MRTKHIASLIAVCALIAGIFIMSRSAPNTDHVVKIGYLPSLGSLAYDVAAETGAFDKAGIKVEKVPLATSNQIIEALVRGDIDMAPLLSVIPVLTSDQVAPGKAQIFSTSDYSLDQPFDKIITKKGSSITSLKSLESKKLGVFPGSTATNLLKAYLAANGVDASKVTFVQIPPPAQLTALYSGAVDALHSYEPNTTIALDSDAAQEVYGSVFAGQLNHSPLGVGIISTIFVRNYPALAKKTVGVIDAANASIKENPEAARIIAAKAFNLEPAVASKIVLVHLSRSTDIDKATFGKYLELLQSVGEIKGTTNLSGLFYTPN